MIPTMRRALLEMWANGETPVAMIRFLRERGYQGARVGVAFSDVFGLRLVPQRFANSWREDGSGTPDDTVNEEVSRGIREAAARRAAQDSEQDSG